VFERFLVREVVQDQKPLDLAVNSDRHCQYRFCSWLIGQFFAAREVTTIVDQEHLVTQIFSLRRVPSQGFLFRQNSFGKTFVVSNCRHCSETVGFLDKECTPVSLRKKVQAVFHHGARERFQFYFAVDILNDMIQGLQFKILTFHKNLFLAHLTGAQLDLVFQFMAPFLQCADTEFYEQMDTHGKSDQDQEIEPLRPPKWSVNGESKLSRRLAPQAVSVLCADAKNVCSWSQVGILLENL